MFTGVALAKRLYSNQKINVYHIFLHTFLGQTHNRTNRYATVQPLQILRQRNGREQKGIKGDKKKQEY